MSIVKLHVNGANREVETDPSTPLLYVLPMTPIRWWNLVPDRVKFQRSERPDPDHARHIDVRQPSQNAEKLRCRGLRRGLAALVASAR